MTVSRYTVTTSAGQRDGKYHAVYDRHERRVVSYHANVTAAMKAVKEKNAEERAVRQDGTR